jgi:zinc transport system substrate-binding protein
MKKPLQIFSIVLSLFIILVIGLFIYPFYNPEDKSGDGKLDIIVSFYPSYDIAKNIVGDYANVEQIIPFGMEPHSFEPSPKDMIKIVNGELFIYTGEHLDHWAEEIAEMSMDSYKFLKLSPSVEIVDEDPHFWLSFSNFKKMVNAIADRLSEMAPQLAGEFQKNRDRYLAEVSELESKFRDGLQNCKLDSVIVNHNAFGYLEREFGFKTVPIMGFSPDEKPSAKKLVEITSLVKKHNISTIFFEELASDSIAQSISNETGAEVSSLSPLGNIAPEDAEKGYLNLMAKNLKNLREALICQ